MRLFINLSVVAAVLRTMTKLNISRSECVNTGEFRRSSIKEHLLFCNHSPDFDDFSILTNSNNGFKVTLMKSPLINREHPFLNKNKQSLR